MRGRDSISQLVSSATFCYRKILTRLWEESYGGHYGPVFAEYIEAQNARQIPNTTKISLESVTIVNGWINPLIQVWCDEPCGEVLLSLNEANPVCRLL